jgi:tRNA(Ile)-lysidine synthase
LSLTAETLRAAVAEIIGDRAAAQDRFGIAVSGGPDSMALLALAAQAFANRIEAATVDHGLRSESAGEAVLVAQYAASIAIPHETLHPHAPITGSVQAAAREARYALLEDWRRERAIDWVLTAHHADDQLETLVMRLNRASGLSGLSGIRTRQGRVLRPLIGVRRAALSDHVRANAIPYVEDPSNRDERFDRARVRAALADSNLVDPVAAARSMANLARDAEALDWAMAQLAGERLSGDEAHLSIDMGGLPTGVMRRLLLMALTRAGEAEPRASTIEEVMAQVPKGVAVMAGNSLISAKGAVWSIRPAPARKQ